MSQPNYITCSCQNCNGHIKFEATALKIGETRRIECPHCHLETVIFNKKSDLDNDPSLESGNTILVEIKSKSSKIELFLFELTRFPTVAGAILVMLAFITAAILAVQALLPEKPSKLPVVTYEMVAVEKLSSETPKSEEGFMPTGAKMAKKPFPQPVTDFLLKHQGFSLKEWLDQLGSEQRQAFLGNLAKVLETATTKNLAHEKIEQLVRDFADLWIATAQDQVAATAKKAAEKQARFSLLTSVASGLFLALMTLSLVLVLLAIERNTRINRKSKEA